MHERKNTQETGKTQRERERERERAATQERQVREFERITLE